MACGTLIVLLFFFFNDTATTEIYTLSLHDALPIFSQEVGSKGHSLEALHRLGEISLIQGDDERALALEQQSLRSEEHTSELQSRQYLVCRLLLEKKKNL